MGSLRYVLRNLSRRRSRTLLGALGIFLTIALLSAIQVGLDSVSVSYVDLVALQAGKADMVIQEKDSEPFRPKAFDPAAVLDKLKGETRIAGFSPRLFGLTHVISGDQNRFAVLIGIDPTRERDLDLSGFDPFPALQPGTCAFSESLARGLNAAPGVDASLMNVESMRETKARVVPSVKKQLVLPQEVRDFVVTDIETARAVLGIKEGVHALAGSLREPRSYYDARDLSASVQRLKDAGESVAGAIGSDYSVNLPKAAAIAAFQNFSSPIRAVFGVFAVLALAIAGLLIYSLISVAVEERIREYAILRTLGAKRRNIIALVLSESTLLCLVGVLPGVPAGIVVARVVLALVQLAIGGGTSGATLTLDVSASTLLLPLAAGILLAFASALLPALNAVRWSLVDALDPLRRGQVRPAPIVDGAASRPLVFSGVALSAISVVVFFVLPSAFLSGDPSLIGTVVLCLILSILLGFTLVAVGVLPLVERGVLALTGWAFGPAAELAGRNLSRHARRNTTTAVMFTLSVSFVIFVASLVALFSRTAMAVVEQGNGADIRIHAGDSSGGAAKAELAAVEGVQAVSRSRFLNSRSARGIAYDVVLEDVVGMKHLWIVPFGVDPDLEKVLYTAGIEWTEGGPDALARLAADRAASGDNTAAARPVIISLAAARALGVSAGDTVQLSFRLGSARRDARFQVAAVCAAFPGFPGVRARLANAVGSAVLISEAAFNDMTRDAPAEAFQALYLVKTGESPGGESAVARRLREGFGARYRFGVESTAEEKSNATAIYWVTQVLFGLLLAVAVIVAVFALIASMATAVLERRWEIGVLKALGLRRGQLFRMFLAESTGITLSSGLCGGAVGFTLAWMFALQASALIEVPVVFAAPWITFAATFAISLVAGAVAAWLPTWRVLRKPAAEIVRAAE